jgi:uncharacterized protein
VTQTRELTFDSGDVTLAGTVWTPAAPRAGVVMVGGSGPSDRNNDVFFPPIREHLLGHDIAVLSYDKRGVGESSGSWGPASIDDFASDAVAAYDVLRAHLEGSAVGFFGHSEGGWTVLRAAGACADLRFLITNSTPGTTPAVQDRWAMAHALRSGGESETSVLSALQFYDELTADARRGASFADVAPRLQSSPYKKYFGDPGESDWQSIRPKLDHDPFGDIAALTCPQLALFGAADPLVPVDESTALFRQARPDVTIEVFPGADHRLAMPDGSLVAGYLDTMSGWIQRVTRTP